MLIRILRYPKLSHRLESGEEEIREVFFNSQNQAKSTTNTVPQFFPYGEDFLSRPHFILLWELANQKVVKISLFRLSSYSRILPANTGSM